MSRNFASSLFGLVMTLALSTAATADVTVEQIGSDLFVFGSNQRDSVSVNLNLAYPSREYYVLVYDYDTGAGGIYYGIDKVWVDTGNGNDYVRLYCFYTGSDVCVDTGNGEDYCYSYSRFGVYSRRSILVEMGNGKDECRISAYRSIIDVSLGSANDRIHGDSIYSYGTVDGEEGKDDFADFVDHSETHDIVNCEE